VLIGTFAIRITERITILEALIMKEKLQDQRVDYQKAELSMTSMNSNPIIEFQKWYEAYEATKPKDPNAFILATADAMGQPRSRVLLLKGLDKGGFEFYTNYESAKGQELALNPLASLCFFWAEIEQQIRVEGKVMKLSPEESTAYFKSRPHGSQIGAWVSPQSQSIESRAVLTQRAAHFAEKYPSDVPRPEHWGGYRLMPTVIEFWQGRSSRLHDRVRYTIDADGAWTKSRLAP
jgi:pyridoxamine 5'-phosphate oxidase